MTHAPSAAARRIFDLLQEPIAFTARAWLKRRKASRP
jgi:hypothetical protein